jgi:hypothetical protein
MLTTTVGRSKGPRLAWATVVRFTSSFRLT